MKNSSSEDLDWVERLAHTMVEHQLHKLEFETEDVSLILRAGRRHGAPQPPAAPASQETEEDVEEADVILIKSKDVGIFRPDEGLKAGDAVDKGQKLATIESVSVEHDLVSEHSGTLVEMVVQEGDPVEYGQPLFVLSESEG